MLGFSFIVFSKAAVTSEPGEGALDHPAFGQDFETGIDAFEHGSPQRTISSPAPAPLEPARHRESDPETRTQFECPRASASFKRSHSGIVRLGDTYAW
jgi:hypothetical protein